VFIPSGGRKWVGEASYVMEAAIANRVHLRLGHPNLQRIGSAAESDQSVLDAQAFGDSETASGELAGYGILQLVVQLPIVFLLCWLFSLSIPFVPRTQ
jgi:short-chain fatty acids transporter